ncbi:MAG: septum formation inhibitor Maf [Geobacteraceae bacterium]|nr:septum formation inhibitor Maf [Geobacteraceae bacterium]
MHESRTIVLASASPRRVELLRSAGISFQVRPGEIDETFREGEQPEAHALRLASEKARAVATCNGGRFFIGADTIVVSGGEVMGKPRDAADAERMLNRLSGTAHEVITGFSVFDSGTGREVAEAVTTRVFFKLLRSDEIHDYIATGCPFDKAGAYAIQGKAAYMIRRIEGSYTNVVGLPLCEVVEALRNLGAIA